MGRGWRIHIDSSWVQHAMHHVKVYQVVKDECTPSLVRYPCEGAYDEVQLYGYEKR